MPRRARPAVVAQPEPAPGVGHNSGYGAWTDEQLIAKRLEIDDNLKAAAKKLEDWAKPLKEQQTEIEQTLFARLNERGADSTRTDAGTAYISTLLNTKVEDREKLFDWAADNWEGYSGDFQINLSKDAVKRYMEDMNGQVPPGMSISHFQRLNVRRG